MLTEKAEWMMIDFCYHHVVIVGTEQTGTLYTDLYVH